MQRCGGRVESQPLYFSLWFSLACPCCVCSLRSLVFALFLFSCRPFSTATVSLLGPYMHFCPPPEMFLKVVLFCRARNLDMTVRAGGHQISGLSIADGALLLDLGRMNAVQVDAGARRVAVEVRATCLHLTHHIFLSMLSIRNPCASLFCARFISAEVLMRVLGRRSVAASRQRVWQAQAGSARGTNQHNGSGIASLRLHFLPHFSVTLFSRSCLLVSVLAVVAVPFICCSQSLSISFRIGRPRAWRRHWLAYSRVCCSGCSVSSCSPLLRIEDDFFLVHLESHTCFL
jgi:hypothetical protein